jgi:D-alanyl-D-alanine carboxypeptidase
MMLIGFAATSTALASDERSSVADQMQAYVRRYVDADLFSGTVLVTKGEHIVYESAFGIADRSFKVANTAATKFQIASLSKPITAAAVLVLADQGKVKIDAPVRTYIPDWPFNDEVTVDELLTHYSGVPDASEDASYSEWSKLPQSPATLVARLAGKRLLFPPGSRYSYSNSNYHALALIIEKVSHVSYGQFVAEGIFRRAGMTNTSDHSSDGPIVPDLARGYALGGVSGFENADYLNWSSKTGNGSLYSTARDLLAFHRALQDNKLLKPTTLMKSYGFGETNRKVGRFWFRRERYGHRSVYVNGSSPGYKAYFERFIDDDAAIIVLSNLYVGAPTEIGDGLGAILWNQPVKGDIKFERHDLNAPQLNRFTGSYRFGAEFYSPNALVSVATEGKNLAMSYPDGAKVILIPTADDTFFDSTYWSAVIFKRDTEGRLILTYRNGSTEFQARHQ